MLPGSYCRESGPVLTPVDPKFTACTTRRRGLADIDTHLFFPLKFAKQLQILSNPLPGEHPRRTGPSYKLFSP
jgi:hypothetical protein